MDAADEREHIDFELTPTTSSTHTPLTFGELYAAEFTPLVRLATLLVGNVEPARDIVQDAFVTLHVKWHTVREPHAYVRRSVVNGATSYHRRNRFRKTSSVGDVEQTISREHRSAANPQTSTTAGFDHTLATLRALNARQRAVVVLKFYEQRTEPEIAAIVGCRVGSVGPTLQRALGILRAHQSPSHISPAPSEKDTRS
ncbi:MAG TPA: sigma-70 family RNA polymerase sigma factor [Ilumatobacter sp.]|nr:sigma-70 family RNA polymerase sigma factor [Ilumatobacter sp.]